MTLLMETGSSNTTGDIIMSTFTSRSTKLILVAAIVPPIVAVIAASPTAAFALPQPSPSQASSRRHARRRNSRRPFSPVATGKKRGMGPNVRGQLQQLTGHYDGGRIPLAMASSPSPATSGGGSGVEETKDGSGAGSYLGDVPMGPPDAILGIAEAFRRSTDDRKVNICVGAFRDENGRPWVLPSVRDAERRMLEDDVNKEYAPIEGDGEFIDLAVGFAYGADADPSRIAAIQSLSGTGACKVAGLFYSKFLPEGTRIYIPDPTWGNHIPIFRNSGLDVRRYRYYDYKTNSLDFDGMLEDIRSAPRGSIILLHACAHNPTGCDPTPDQWRTLSREIAKCGHHVFFDSAYQGFATGDAERDAAALRMFVDDGHDVVLAQSFAKNFGLYGERCGTMSVVCPDAETRDRVMSQLKLIVRPMYSNPPIHGGNIVKTVLSRPDLRDQYYGECESMARRIRGMRELLVAKLGEKGSTHDWGHVLDQIGMFAYTGMTPGMCDELTDRYSIFLTKDGRVSLAGLNEGNIDYVAEAIHDVTDGKSICRE